MEQHRATAQRVQHLRRGGTHPRAFAGGEHHRGDRSVRTHPLMFPSATGRGSLVPRSGARVRTSTRDSKGLCAAVTPPPNAVTLAWPTRGRADLAVPSRLASDSAMGSLIKKRRKRMRKKKHKKLLKKTRWQRRQQVKKQRPPGGGGSFRGHGYPGATTHRAEPSRDLHADALIAADDPRNVRAAPRSAAEHHRRMIRSPPGSWARRPRP